MININDRIKINEELCPEDKRSTKKFQFGALNYFALFLAYEFEVVRMFKDEYHDDMVEVTATDPKFRSKLVFKASDVVLAEKKMLKMDFEILSKVNKFQGEIDRLKKEETALISIRNVAKRKGTAVTDRALVDNWNEIKRLRAKIKTLDENTEKVFRVKHKLGIFDLDCKEDQIPSKLRSIIRGDRTAKRKLNVETKSIGGGLTFEKVGGVLTKPAKFAELNEKFAINIIKEHKSPQTEDNYVGIEIEMLSSKSIENMNKEFVKARLHRFVNIGTDVSIRNEGGGEFFPMELRICLPEKLLESHLKLICDVLRKNDCYANRTCGMHVHIDMRQRNPELCYRNFFKVQSIMLATQPISRRNNRYCMPNTKPELKLKEFNGDGSDTMRRLAINTMSYSKNNMKTIEIRIHEGATKYKDILNWVKFLVATASLKADLSKVINNITELERENYLETSVIKHLGERIEEYSA